MIQKTESADLLICDKCGNLEVVECFQSPEGYALDIGWIIDGDKVFCEKCKAVKYEV